MPEPIRLGLIGCGHWGRNYAVTIPHVENATLTWCADTSDRARAQAAALHPGARVTADYRELVSAADCDAVIVAAPPSQHAAIARVVLASRKHVLVEKPLATTLSEARALATEARSTGLVALSAHVYLSHPVVREIAGRIESGASGKLRFMTASRMLTRLASSDDRPDVDALWDLAPNDLAMFVEFAGTLPERVFCARSAFFRRDLADAAFAILHFPGGAIGELRVSWDYPLRERLVTVVGSNEALVFDDDAECKLLRYSVPSFGAPACEPIACSSQSSLSEQIRRFVEAIAAGRPAHTSFDAGARIVHVLEALTESATTGKPVRLTSSP